MTHTRLQHSPEQNYSLYVLRLCSNAITPVWTLNPALVFKSLCKHALFILKPVASLSKPNSSCYCDLNPSLSTYYFPQDMSMCLNTCIVSPGAIQLRSFCKAVFRFSSIMSARQKQQLFEYTTYHILGISRMNIRHKLPSMYSINIKQYRLFYYKSVLTKQLNVDLL